MCLCVITSGCEALFNPVSNRLNEWEMSDFFYSISSPSKEQHHKKVSKVLDLVSGHLILVPFVHYINQIT